MVKKQFPQSAQHTVSPKHILGAVVALVIFFLLLTSVIGLAQKYFAIRERSKELAAEQVTLKQKQADLTATNAYLATPEGTEQSLRERYDYVKPGEQMIVVTPDADTTPPAPEPTGVAHWWDELLRGLGIRKDPQN
jgi:cell division protein FtsB